MIKNKTQIFAIEGIGCASCVKKIESALNELPDIHSAQVNFSDRTATVTGKVDLEKINQRLSAIGYSATLITGQPDDQYIQQKQDKDFAQYRKHLLHSAIALILGLPLMIAMLIMDDMQIATSTDQWVWGSVGIACLLVIIVSGRHFYTGAWIALKNLTADMNTLIALGTGAAWVYSILVVTFPYFVPENARYVYFEASAMIIGFVNLGLALESKARGKTSEAIKRLIGLQPKTARVVREREEVDIPIEQVIIGDRVRVRPGEKIAVDGIVVDGHSNIDESMLTGEPMPVLKQIDSDVFAGSVNQSGSILFKATRIGKETTLAQIISLVRQAQNSKLPIGKLADSIARYFIPAVIFISACSGFFWWNFGPEPKLAYTLVTSISVLIIACPCALGLATPISVMVGIGKAAEFGVLIRNGDGLQMASKMTTLILDKTGTITEGNPQITDVISSNLDPNFDSEDDILAMAALLESRSEHPIAKAILNEANHRRLTLDHPLQDFMSIAGGGIKASANGSEIILGNQILIQQSGIEIESLSSTIEELTTQAKTPVLLAINKVLVGIIAVADPIKKDSNEAITRLKQQGLHLILMTGDNFATAKAIADQVGIEEFYAQTLPADKSAKVQALQQQHQIVGMTGDGINDAPALAQANIGFAIGTGTDIAMESADITLMRGSLHGIADSIEISKATLNNIKQNLLGTFVYNIAGIPIAAGVLFPFTGALLNPIIAGAAMAFSSVTVVSNANRLRLFKPGKSI